MQIEFNLDGRSGPKGPAPVRKNAQWLLCLALVSPLTGCSLFTAAPPEVSYSKTVNQALYHLELWALDGRVALTGAQDSWTADLAWSHRRDDERISLSGPLGQGAVKIHLSGETVTVAEGDGKVESSDDPEGFINQRLGMFVPVTSLRYWVLGVPEPELDFEETGKGFRQAGWTIAFQAMQRVGDWLLPRKMSVANERVKLKLIINEWTLHDGKMR
ncbi:lipoprotein insertase outer membrane protein LolB [Methylomicrobium agile]|uniref:lipoprotein insertase outer membrane protein LolB n=1 Tax=Methylomicrobium agile TaxID=39774 RepID=UPI0004DF11B0|nr:lipoprotein insertase outer membrane protein LolB [Methylomicrobium agile]